MAAIVIGGPEGAGFLDLAPYLGLLLNLLEITGIIPDPLSLILSLFAGRPKPEATAAVADWLMHARNPAARLWGIEIGRYEIETGAVLSDGHPSVQTIFHNFRSQFVTNLERQGVSALNASRIADLAYSVGSQGKQPYPVALTRPLPQGFTIGGPSSIETLYQQGLDQATKIGLTGQPAINHAQKYVLEHADLQQLYKIKVGNPQKCTTGQTYDWPTDTCVTGGQPPRICPQGQVWDPTTQSCIPVGPNGPQCPPGYTWNAQTNSCQLTTQPQQCPPGFHWDPTVPPAGACVPDLTPPGGDDPDELVALLSCLCPSLTTIANAVVQLVQYLEGNQTSPQTDQCCQNVVAALQSVVDAIALLTNSLPGGIDLSSIDADLKAIAAALASGTALNPADLAAIAPAITSGTGNIANAIANQKGTDVSGIVDELKQLVLEGDIAQPILDYLIQNGFIDPGLGQQIHGAPWAAAFLGYFRTMIWNGITNWWKTIGGTGYTSTFKPLPLSQTIANDIAGAISTALTAGAEPIYPVIKGIIDAVVAILTPAHTPLPADIGVDPDVVLSKTLAPALIVNGIALIADYFGWEISEQLREYVDITTTFVGLEEVKELKVGARMRNGPAKVADMQAKALYRQELPGFTALAGLVARGLYSPARASALRPLTGLPDELEKPLQEAAYEGINARQLIRLLPTGLFTPADIQDELTFGGMRPISQKRMLLVAPYLATNSERTQARAALEAQFVAGFLDQSGLTAQIDSLEQNTDRDALIMVRVNAQKIVQEGKALETEYTTMYIGGLIDDPTYRNYLTAIGLQPDMVNIVAGKAEARANSTLRRETIRAAAQQAKQTAHFEQRAALQSFKDGVIDVAALTAALIATGLTPTQAAAWTAQANMLRLGSLRWQFGLQLQPSQATQLKARVTALVDQRKKQLITQTAFVDALKALNLPPHWINALDAQAEASLTPKTSAFAVPVQTS